MEVTVSPNCLGWMCNLSVKDTTPNCQPWLQPSAICLVVASFPLVTGLSPPPHPVISSHPQRVLAVFHSSTSTTPGESLHKCLGETEWKSKSRAAPQQIWEDSFISVRLINFTEPFIRGDTRIAQAVSQHEKNSWVAATARGEKKMLIQLKSHKSIWSRNSQISYSHICCSVRTTSGLRYSCYLSHAQDSGPILQMAIVFIR